MTKKEQIQSSISSILGKLAIQFSAPRKRRVPRKEIFSLAAIPKHYILLSSCYTLDGCCVRAYQNPRATSLKYSVFVCIGKVGSQLNILSRCDFYTRMVTDSYYESMAAIHNGYSRGIATTK